MMVQAQEEMGEGSANPTDPHHTPTITQPSTSQPQKKQPRRKQRKDTEVSHLNGEDSLKLNELMELCTNLQKKVLDLETTMNHSSTEIDSLKGSEEAEKNKRRKNLDIDADEDITLDSIHVDTDLDMFGVHNLHDDEVFVEIEEPVVNAATTTTTTVFSLNFIEIQ
ncbi:hypothetical protein Tco_0997268 [Tanacetum coccineum]